MRKWIMGAVCAAMIGATSQGYAAKPEQWTGRWLLEIHEAKSDSFFFGFVIGASGPLGAYGIICPWNANFKAVVDAVHLWMRLNPKELDQHAYIVVTKALKHHFPCD